MTRHTIGSALWVALAIACMTPVVARAQDAPAPPQPAPRTQPELTIDQEIAMVRSLTEAQRQATVAANLVLTDTESAKFWPIYREYRLEVAKINDKLIALIKDYSENFAAVTDEKAKTYTKDYLATQKSRVELMSKYVGKYDKVLPPVKTARAMQIESKLDALVDAGLAKTIPLVRP